MKIMCIHGIGHQEERKDTWNSDWVPAITKAVREWSPAEIDIQQFAYDDLFEAADSSSLVYFTALAKLIKNWVVHAGERDIFGLFDKYRWTVGMVAQFVALETLRIAVRAKLAAEIAEFKPDVIVAHSLGGLIAYDTLSSSQTQGKLGGFNGRLITIGTQVAHPAVCDVFGGRIQRPPMLAHWWNFHNEDDVMFTRSFALPGEARFKEVRTPFEFQLINHDADHYLQHEQARSECWRELLLGSGGVRGIAVTPALDTGSADAGAKSKGKVKGKASAAALAASANAAARAAATAVVPVVPTRPKLRALLVGIAEYANPAYALEGPVNDVFLVSQTLQQMGVDADAIRVVLNDRATATAIRERLAWLLADAQNDDTMFFYFSGHGAQVPAYGRDAEVDSIDECLVPYDFNWQTGNAIFDDEFAALYSQLPYAARFVAMFDCCHAGGMQRGGAPGMSGVAGARSVAMPDDIRHRALRWDTDSRMWLPRKPLLKAGEVLKDAMIKQEAKKTGKARATAKVEARVGADGTLRRIGRAQALRGDKPADYEARRKEYGHHGPYMPILLEACAEAESAYEYQHGSVSYGAFTYALCEAMNQGRKPEKNQPVLSFEQLIESTRLRVQPVASGPQTPQLVCATTHRSQPVFG
jgi:hypothetical protein